MFTETINRFNRGEVSDRTTIRKVLTEIRGYTCSCCGISDYNSKPLTLQVDHTDGNAGNNSPDNLRLICPNCHSQTDTFSARNKGNGRAARGLPLN
jgi:5-methylcytosine-specific restriction endonuclease McrA